MKITVVIPMYNESGIISDTARVLSEYMSAHFESYEIIFFDDGSTDGSARLVETLALPCVRVLGTNENHGKGSAVRRAMLEATGDVRVFTDADLAYGVDVIRRVYEMMLEQESIDVVIGSRNMGDDGYEGYSFKRKLMSKLYIKVLCFVGGFKLSDSQCGFKAFRAQTADEIFSRCTVDGFAFDFEVILNALKYQKQIEEMPVKIINHRSSSIRPVRDAVRMLRDLRKIKKNVKNS